MNSSSISKAMNKNKQSIMEFDHYIAFDWSQENVALARMTRKAAEPKVIEWDKSDIKAIKEYLSHLRGTIILTFEETTNSQWLYVEFKDMVNRIIVCDPYRNHLLSTGPKTDKIDARKLCLLLKAGFLKEVYHTNDRLYEYRCLLSAYTDLVKAGVRIQNQRNAVYRARGMNLKKQDPEELKHRIAGFPLRNFVIDWQNRVIENYSEDKKLFEEKIEQIVKSNKNVKNLTHIPGIGVISAFKIFAIVIQPQRFKGRGCYLSYCGLVLYEKSSGGRSYGKRSPRYNRELKAVYLMAARAVIQGGNNPISEYYEKLIEKGLSSKQACLQIARYIARVSLGMMKNGQKYDAYRWRKDEIAVA